MRTTPNLAWFKSSYSGSQGDDCVEVALAWHKSSYTSGSEGDCLEVATSPGTIHIRDSKGKESPQLALSPATWAGFLAYAVKV